MTDDNGIHQGYEDSHIPAAAAVASPQYLLSQILDRLAAVEEENRQQDRSIREDDEIAALEAEKCPRGVPMTARARKQIEPPRPSKPETAGISWISLLGDENGYPFARYDERRRPPLDLKRQM
jgi:hypothetical protein